MMSDVGTDRNSETQTPGRDFGFGGTRASAAPQGYLSGLIPDDDAVDGAADMDTNLLHGGEGSLCERCGHEIREGQPVRRTVSGAYQHDTC